MIHASTVICPDRQGDKALTVEITVALPRAFDWRLESSEAENHGKRMSFRTSARPPKEEGEPDPPRWCAVQRARELRPPAYQARRRTRRERRGTVSAIALRSASKSLRPFRERDRRYLYAQGPPNEPESKSAP